MTRPYVQRSLLVVFGMLAATALLETGVRLLGLAPRIDPIVLDRPYATFISSPNPILRYVPKPGADGISAYGLRDFDYPLAKPDGTYRILVLGDSIAFGYCNPTEFIARDDTFPKVLERRLNDPPLPGIERVEVINLSVSGYDTAQEVEFLRVKGLAFDPDLVLVAYCLNDAEESSTELEGFREDESWETFELLGAEASEMLLMKSHLVRAIWYQLGQLGAGAAGASTAAARDPRADGFDALSALSRDARGVGNADGTGFDTLIAIFPNLYSFRPYRYRADHEETARMARARSFAVIDLLGPFHRASGGAVALVRGRCTSVHPDENGHRVAALALERFIRGRLHATRRTR